MAASEPGNRVEEPKSAIRPTRIGNEIRSPQKKKKTGAKKSGCCHPSPPLTRGRVKGCSRIKIAHLKYCRDRDGISDTAFRTHDFFSVNQIIVPSQFPAVNSQISAVSSHGCSSCASVMARRVLESVPVCTRDLRRTMAFAADRAKHSEICCKIPLFA